MGSSTNLSADEKLKKINAALVSYEETKGIPQGEPHNEGIVYLNMNEKDLRTMSAEDAGAAAAVLAQYSYHIQRALNEERAVVNWIDAEIRRSIFNEISQYSGATAEERKSKAIAGNEYTKKLDRLRAQAQARVDRLEYLPNRIDAIRLSLVELQATKRKHND